MVPLLLIWILFRTFVTTGTTEFVVFKEEPQDIKVIEGESATLKCTIHPPQKHCYWLRNQTVIDLENNEELLTRYQIANDVVWTGNCGLHILKTDVVLDNNKWTCATGESRSRTAQLTVLVKPSLPAIVLQDQRNALSGSNVTVKHGSLFKATCVTHAGNPPPKIEWVFQGVESRFMTNKPCQMRPGTYDSDGHLTISINEKFCGQVAKCIAIHELYHLKKAQANISIYSNLCNSATKPLLQINPSIIIMLIFMKVLASCYGS